MKPVLILLALLGLASSLSAAVQVGNATSAVLIAGTITQPPNSLEFAEQDDGNNNVRLEKTLALEDVDESTGESIAVEISLLLENNNTVAANTGSGLRVTASGRSDIVIEAYNDQDVALPDAGLMIDTGNPGNENIREFTVTGRRTPCRLTGTLEATSLATILYLEEWTAAEEWEPVRIVQQSPFDHHAILPPGEYRLRATITGSALTNLIPNTGSYEYDLQVGTIVGAEHTDPRIGTDVTDSPKLRPVSAAILSETDQGNGTTEVVVTVSLRNTSPCPWAGVEVNVPATFPGAPDVTPPALPLTFPDLPAASTTPPYAGESLTVVVPTADLPAFRASILDGSRFTATGRELWVFLFPVVIADGKIEEGDSESLIFTGTVDFAPGTIFLEVEEEYSFPPDVLEGYPDLTIAQGVDRLLPFLVSEIRYEDNGTAQPTIVLSGDQIALTDVIRHGSVRSSATVTPPSGLDVTRGAVGDVVPKIQPVHFNRRKVNDAVEVSGSFLLTPGPFGVEFEMEDTALKRFAVTATVNAEANLLLETTADTDNTGDPLAQQETQLFAFDLFSIALPAGFRLTPEISLAAGASVDAPSGLSVPVHASLQIGFTAGVEDGVPFYDSEVVASPPRVSTPAIYEQLQASANAWIAAQIKCGIGIADGVAEIGPTFGVRVGGEFALAPLANPWWSLDGDLELLAGLELELLGLITIADVERSIFNEPLFHLDAGGPLLAPTKAVTLPDNPGLRPLAGQNTRWARILQPENIPADSETGSFVLPLTGSDDFIAGTGETFGGEMSRFGPDGELKWSLDTDPAPVISAVAEPDGTFTTLSTGFSRIHLGRFDADGNRLWAVSDKFEGILGNDTRRIARGENASGDPEYYILSRTSDGVRKPGVVKYDQDGTRLWAKLYTPDPAGGEGSACELRDCLVTSDGNLVFVGTTDADIQSGQGPLNTINSTDNGLAVKVHGQTGEVLWSTLIAHERIPQYKAIAEGPDGSLYLGGNHATSVLDDVPSMLVTKLDADGNLLDSVLIGHDTGADDPTGLGASGLLAPLPHNGGTPYDIIQDMVWIDDALWVGGQIGIYNSSLGFTNGTSAFTARLTAKLGVTRFALHAGTHYDQIGALADGGDGLLAVGTSRSFLPWPHGAANQADNTSDARLVMKLPWEGVLRFHERTAGAQPAPSDSEPDSGTFFVYPASFPGSNLPTFALNVPTANPEDPDDLVFSDTLPFVVTDLTLSTDTPLAAPFPLTPVAHHALESMPTGAIDSFADYLDWHQLAPDGDHDSDGLCESAEFFFGTDPFTADAGGAAFTIEPNHEGVLSLTFPRSVHAGAEGWLSPLQASNDLENWFSLPDATLNSEPLSADLDKLIYAPFIAPGEPDRFYRLVKPVAP